MHQSPQTYTRDHCGQRLTREGVTSWCRMPYGVEHSHNDPESIGPDEAPVTDSQLRSRARDQYHDEGRIEIDDLNAPISRPEGS
jgi:hypothetical protein